MLVPQVLLLPKLTSNEFGFAQFLPPTAEIISIK
jgi:hypothetical protein